MGYGLDGLGWAGRGGGGRDAESRESGDPVPPALPNQGVCPPALLCCPTGK
jgi:hypothetical protein